MLPLILMPIMLFSGFFVNGDELPIYFRWIKYASPPKYTFQALAINQYTGFTVPNCNPLDAICTGQAALEQLGFAGGLTIWECFVILALMYAVLTAVGFFALVVLSRRKKM